MSLDEYRRKRDFGRTREPQPGKKTASGQRAIFVVQLHHARRRHYDLRLQVGDTLKSWAVPKGPSFDPKVKRLAAEVEDHPVSYAHFEGVIPEGEYGGGHVALFDQGVWATQGDPQAQLAKGHLHFQLFGKRLQGSWHLVRTARSRAQRPEWLLFKEQDAFAGEQEADDLLAQVTPPPLDSNAAGQRPGKPRRRRQALAVAEKTPAVKQRRRAIDWEALALALPGARKARLAAAAFTPQLARLREHPPAGEAWLHELKWDGYRIVATIVRGQVQLWSRNAIEWTAKLPEVVQALEGLGLDEAGLDGELIAAPGDQSSFSALQGTLSGERNAPLSYVLFDLTHLQGVSLVRAPLLARKTLLQRMIGAGSPPLVFSSHAIGDGQAAFAMACRRRFEGIISKRVDAPYCAGRGDGWVKIKKLHSDEFAVVGVTAPKGARAGFGSLLLARPDPRYGWVYAGRVGSGFDAQQLREIARHVGKQGERQPTVHVAATDTDLRTARWFAPRFVVEVFARGIGSQGLLRQPSLKAVRLDKNPDDLLELNRQPAMKPTAAQSSAAKKRVGQRAGARGTAAGKSAAGAEPAKKTARGDDEVGGHRLSSPDRIVYPDAGITKRQVAVYYLAVAEHLLREMQDRPLSIVRCPEGADRACFFQKHHTPGLEAVGSQRLKEESGRQADYLVVHDLDGLMALVQFNALEFHPWGAKATRPDKADRIVFDLDPGPGVEWSAVKKAALKVRDLLAQVGLASFLRTSGGKGLHVVAPLNPGCSWALVKKFTRAFAEAMAQAEPERFVATASKSLREGRIFIDYLRNGRGATSVASYSLRARPGAPVAVPLAWSELARLPRANHFDLHSVPKRLARLKADPWQDIDRIEQDLSRWDEITPSHAKKR